MFLKPTLIKLHWLLASQFGLDPQRFLRSLRGLPIYFRDWIAFRKGYTGKMKFMPCLHDRYEEGGATKSEYFWQDLLVARAIHAANPVKHVDIGSRIDGFVAHVASFRSIEIFDVRPVRKIIPNVNFIQADLMNPLTAKTNYCDSISCLHAIEHFGLGRYGDPIDVDGYKAGLKNMAALLQDKGTFYLSTPIGVNRVEFNANRVFDPKIILEEAKLNYLEIQKMIVINNDCSSSEYEPHTIPLGELASQNYALGIFVFKKMGA